MTGILNCSAPYGTIALNGVELNDDWVCFYDLSPLLDDFEVRGSDTLLPHVSRGVIPHRRRRTVSRKDLRFLLSGWKKWDGTVYSDRPMGLIENAEHLRATIGIATTGPGPGTVVLSWDRPDGSTLEADVHVIAPLRLERPIDSVCRGALTLSFPRAEWVSA